MPRLLLVDDNPSIHRIAESLLAPTDVDLVCAGSAAEALDRLSRGEHYDVALVDTAMPGMDGWTLVSRLRADAQTATMPIALMAGVLDPVDPARLAAAPVQGFLKKPIELRELGDRVKTLLATPVAPPSPSPFSTVPSTPARELLAHAESALPEFRPTPTPAEPPAEEDLLILTEEDLWPEEAPEPVLAEPDETPEVQLELEELDLESLQLSGPESAPLAPLPPLEAPTLPESVLGPLPDLEDLDLGPVPEALPDLGAPPADEAEVTAEGPEVTHLVEAAMASFDHAPESEPSIVSLDLTSLALEPEVPAAEPDLTSLALEPEVPAAALEPVAPLEAP
ncbi:MAG TPA: response regulator, partial [Holophagaceae bacterium]